MELKEALGVAKAVRAPASFKTPELEIVHITEDRLEATNGYIAVILELDETYPDLFLDRVSLDEAYKSGVLPDEGVQPETWPDFQSLSDAEVTTHFRYPFGVTSTITKPLAKVASSAEGPLWFFYPVEPYGPIVAKTSGVEVFMSPVYRLFALV